MKTLVLFEDIDTISHCDHESCEYGRLEYECPYCNKINIDYDNWSPVFGWDFL